MYNNNDGIGYRIRRFIERYIKAMVLNGAGFYFYIMITFLHFQIFFLQHNISFVKVLSLIILIRIMLAIGIGYLYNVYFTIPACKFQTTSL